MAHIRRACLVCDQCGERIDIDPSIEDPFLSATMKRDNPWTDWIHVRGRHLCPGCAERYREVEAEAERMLDEAAGIKKIEFDI